MSQVPDRVARRSALPRAIAVWLSVVAGAPIGVAAQERMGPAPPATAAARSSIAAPRLTFEENRGQLDPKVRFVSRSPRDTLFLTADEAVLSLKGSRAAGQALRMRFRNASTTTDVLGLDPLSSVTYYPKATTRGRLEPTRSYQRVRYSKLYPGIDLEYYRTDGHLEFDLHVARPDRAVLHRRQRNRAAAGRRPRHRRRRRAGRPRAPGRLSGARRHAARCRRRLRRLGHERALRHRRL
jgi:hypothetical protein